MLLKHFACGVRSQLLNFPFAVDTVGVSYGTDNITYFRMLGGTLSELFCVILALKGSGAVLHCDSC